MLPVGRTVANDIDALVRDLESPSTSVRHEAAIALSGFGRGARPAIPEMIVALKADPSLGFWLANAIAEIGPPADCVDSLLQLLNCKEAAFWAGRALTGLGSDMKQSVIERLLSDDYSNACFHFAVARPNPDAVLAAVISLASADGVFPRHAIFIPGTPPTYIGEQIRKVDDGRWIAANCRSSAGVKAFRGVQAASEYFVKWEMDW